MKKRRLIDLNPKQKIMSLSLDTEQILTHRQEWRKGFLTGFLVGMFVFGVSLCLMLILICYIKEIWV